MNEQELLQLKRKIEEAREQSTRLETRKEVLMEELSTKFGISSLEEAVQKLSQMEVELDEEEKEIQAAMSELETTLQSNARTTQNTQE